MFIRPAPSATTNAGDDTLSPKCVRAVKPDLPVDRGIRGHTGNRHRKLVAGMNYIPDYHIDACYRRALFAATAPPPGDGERIVLGQGVDDNPTEAGILAHHRVLHELTTGLCQHARKQATSAVIIAGYERARDRDMFFPRLPQPAWSGL